VLTGTPQELARLAPHVDVLQIDPGASVDL
jgi:hypothetical protein